jgi:uncharacterized protein (DUF3084 family)
MAAKISTANIPLYRLDPKEAAVLVAIVGIVAYLLGFFVGLTF